jgi:ribosomal protein S18 acetylase RimI-like enzyme
MDELDNVFWVSLAGPHRHLSAGGDRARRYAPGLPAIAAFPDPERPDFTALAELFHPEEPFYTSGWSGAAPAGWRIDVDARMFLMVFGGAPPAGDPAPEAVALGTPHAERMVALAALTRPGPFGPRNIEMGEYYGVLAGERLLAMAGERMHAGRYREISAVCTDPSHQGRGLARRLTEKLVGLQVARGQTPFLHVMSHNERARGIYERMGFRIHREVAVRVVARKAAAGSTLPA